jgi:formyl-CoA transferase
MEDPAIDELLALPTGNADQIDERMDHWLAGRDRAEVVHLAQELRIPFTEVFTPAEIIDDPHLAERGFFVGVEHPELGEIFQPGGPAQLSATPWRMSRAPLLGEHTAEVLREWIEVDDAVLAELGVSGEIP